MIQLVSKKYFVLQALTNFDFFVQVVSILCRIESRKDIKGLNRIFIFKYRIWIKIFVLNTVNSGLFRVIK